MRVPDSLLRELIEHKGWLKSGPIRETGILRLALDLRDARELIARYRAGEPMEMAQAIGGADERMPKFRQTGFTVPKFLLYLQSTDERTGTGEAGDDQPA